MAPTQRSSAGRSAARSVTAQPANPGGALDLGDALAKELRPEDRLQYYKQRLHLAERELADVQAWVEKGLSSQADVHAAQWEARKRETENTELRKALSDAHLALWEERQARLKVEARSDEIKVQQLESHRKMQHLLALTQPVAQEVNSAYGQSPDGLIRAPHAWPASGAMGAPGGLSKRPGDKGNLAAAARAQPVRRADGVEKLRVPASNAAWPADGVDGDFHAGDENSDEQLGGGRDVSLRGMLASAAKGATTHGCGCGGAAPRSRMTYAAPAPTGGEGGAAADAGGRILRTVYLPNERADGLLATVDSLRAQLRRQEQLSSERFSAMLEDRRAREAQAEHERAALAESHEKALGQLQKAEGTLAQTVRDYLTLRSNAWQRQSRDADTILVRGSRARARPRPMCAEAVPRTRCAPMPRPPALSASCPLPTPPATAWAPLTRACSRLATCTTAAPVPSLPPPQSLREELAKANAQIADLVKRAAEHMRGQEQAAAARGGGWDSAYRAKLRGAEEANELLVEKHAALELAASARVAALEAQVERLKAQLLKLSARRQLDNEGFASEAAQLRRLLDRRERSATRLQQRGEPSPRPSSASAEPEREQLDTRALQRIRERLEQLEANLNRGGRLEAGGQARAHRDAAGAIIA